MQTPANIAKHPIHPMLVAFPIGLWIFSLVCDLINLGSATPNAWATVAYYAMIGGLAGALAAAVPGLIDLLSLKDPEVKRIALTHMAINLAVVTLYVVNIFLRMSGPENLKVPILLSVIGVGMLVVSGWLGGKMVYLHGVGVDTGPSEPR